MEREVHRMASLRRESSLWRRGDDVFSRSSSRFQDDQDDDEEALRWAALERLPTFDRVRRGILMVEDGGEKVEVDVGRLGARESRALIERLVRAADDDHERFLLKLKERMDRVGIDYPTIEVRFEKLEVEAEVHVGDRGLPTLVNSVSNTIEAIGNALHIFPSRKQSMTVLHDVSGIIKPRRRNKELIEELSTPPPGSTDLNFPTQYSRSFFTQCLACLWKQNWSYWRNPSYTAVRLLFTIVIALMFGTMFWDLGRKTKKQQDLFNAMGSMYAAVLYIGVQNSGSVQPVVVVERTVFYRERAAGMYSAFPYAFGQVAIEFPYIMVQTLIYGVLVYSMIGFEWTVTKFLWYLFFMYFTLLYFTFYGMMAVGLTPNESIAAIISAAFYNIWNLFSGYLIPRPRIPIWWRWYCWICPVAWTLYGLVASQFGDLKHSLEGETQSVAQFITDYFGFHHDFLWVVAIVHVVFALTFAFLFSFAIMKFNFQRR
ncbi:hypothetical protein ABZP36_017060 [Zizania latifolia]